MTNLQPIAGLPDLQQYQAGDAASALVRASTLVRRRAGWHITPSITETLTLDGTGARFIYLPSLHVTDIVSVTENGTLLDADDYNLTAGQNLMRSNRSWCFGSSSIVIELEHGWPAEDCGDLQDVIMAKVSRLDRDGISREQAGPFSTQYEKASGFTEDEENVIAKYALGPRS